MQGMVLYIRALETDCADTGIVVRMKNKRTRWFPGFQCEQLRTRDIDTLKNRTGICNARLALKLFSTRLVDR